ncbi:hypothetical protein ACFXG4_20550 [Nocardia sp. NPDC059246]|uniref:hypothetical protein n=1 Tax=unclassified Nocardia TaxID=2637762 RepID=UPI0036AC2588
MIGKYRFTSLLGIGLIAIVVVVGTLRGGHPDSEKSQGDIPATSTLTPPSSPSRDTPTTDLFGNRLEAAATPAGEALQQDSGSRPDPAGPDYLKAPPRRVQWQSGWGGAALPFSGSDGPTQVIDGIASGFAHTPQGAALAACDALARALSAPEGLWQNVVRERFVGGGQPLINRIAANRTDTPAIASYVVVPDGLRVLPNYQPDLAVVQIAMRAPGGWAYGTWPMTWQAGDWRVRVPDDIGVLWQGAVQIYSLDEFGSWKGGTA